MEMEGTYLNINLLKYQRWGYALEQQNISFKNDYNIKFSSNIFVKQLYRSLSFCS